MTWRSVCPRRSADHEPSHSADPVWLPDTSTTRHFGIKTLWDTSAPILRHFNTKNVIRDTSTRVPWSRKSPDTSTQDNSDETQLHRWFGLNFGTNLWCRTVLWPKCPAPPVSQLNCNRFEIRMRTESSDQCTWPFSVSLQFIKTLNYNRDLLEWNSMNNKSASDAVWVYFTWYLLLKRT